MLLRPMDNSDEFEVRRVYRLCHPGWPARPDYWFFVHPTIVAIAGAHESESGREELAGFTSFSINQATGLTVMQGQDCCVLPEYRGQNLGRQLHNFRIHIARAIGAKMFTGTTQPENKAMQQILLGQGLHLCQTIPQYFPGGEDALMFVGPVGDK